MMMRLVILSASLLLLLNLSYAQSQNYTLGDDYNYHIIDRLDIRTNQDEIFTSFKPYQRGEIIQLLEGMESSGQSDKFNKNYLLQDSWEYADSVDYLSNKPLLKYLYQSKSDFYHFKNEDLNIHLNPILGYQIGSDGDSDDMIFTNTRGVEVRGMIDQKVSFYTALTENQLRYPSYIRDYQLQNGVVPGQAFWKLYNDTGYDFIFARGHISFNATKHINVQLGHDRFSIGNGFRSMMLSDFGANYPFLKLKTKVWKLQYTNLYAQLTSDVGFFDGGTLGTAEFPKKFMTMHHLSFNLTDNLNVGLFESIIFSRQDSIGNNQFEFNYLNPIILYRYVEQHTGSPDNALLGLDFKWNLAQRLSFYGQFLIDELIVSNLRDDKGNWTNKFAFQLGGKYINAFGINNLDLQAEYNFARPFLYAHDTESTNYAHYNQPLAHPLGANFKEMVGILRYQPIPRLYARGRLIISDYGRDPEGQNLGGNILEPYITRTSETGHFVGQGDNYQLIHADLRLTYQLKHNLFIDFNQAYRRLSTTLFEATDSNTSTTLITSIGFRLNIASTDLVY